MPAKKLKVGDPVLWYGFDLEVTALEKNDNGQTLAVVEETAKADARAEAMARIKELRAAQDEASANVRAAFDTIKEIEALPASERGERLGDLRAARQARRDAEDAHADAASEIQALDAVLSDSIVRAKLRADLLSYWPEREVWVSDGRILNDDQREAAQATLGIKANHSNERAVLGMLEAGV